MKTNNRQRPLFSILIAVLLALTWLLGTPGCTTSQRRTTYNTLASLELTTTKAYDGYLGAVISGQARTNDLPQITRDFNAFQKTMQVAILTARNNTNALASPNLEAESSKLLDAIAASFKALSPPSTGPPAK